MSVGDSEKNYKDFFTTQNSLHFEFTDKGPSSKQSGNKTNRIVNQIVDYVYFLTNQAILK